MSLKTITRRLERLERKVNVVVAPENLPFDYDLLTPKEQDLSSVTHLLHDKAVELGYGKLEACQYHFVRNPWLDDEVFAECVVAFTDEERLRYERAIEIFEKCTRLTSCLTDEEKEAVKEFLGHRSINSTLMYIQLEQALFDKNADSFTCKVAKTPEEIKLLIESGFEYVTEKDGLIYFRKRK